MSILLCFIATLRRFLTFLSRASGSRVHCVERLRPLRSAHTWCEKCYDDWPSANCRADIKQENQSMSRPNSPFPSDPGHGSFIQISLPLSFLGLTFPGNNEPIAMISSRMNSCTSSRRCLIGNSLQVSDRCMSLHLGCGMDEGESS